MDDWQSKRSTIKECMSYWFNNSTLSDVTFVVHQKRLPGHKFVLASRSSVFFAMFYGPIAESNSEVKITDCEDPNHFLEFLKFLYTDDCNLTWSNLFIMMYLADKYFVTQLFTRCEDFLKSQLNKDTALLALQEAEKYNNAELTQRSLEVIRPNASEVLKQENFQLISLDALKIILKDDRLAVSEIDVFRAVEKWCRQEQKRKNLPDNPSSLREVIGNGVYLIRFPGMKAEDFARHCAHSGLLLPEESRDIYSNILLEGKVGIPKLSFPSQPRRFSPISPNYKTAVINQLPQNANAARPVIGGFSPYHTPAQTTIFMSSVTMTFQVEKNIQLCGMGFCVKQEEAEMLPAVGIQCLKMSGPTGAFAANADAAVVPFSIKKDPNPTVTQVALHPSYVPPHAQRYPDLFFSTRPRAQVSRPQAWAAQPSARFVKSQALFDHPITIEENTRYKVVVTAQWQMAVIPIRRNMPEDVTLDNGGKLIFTISNLFFLEFLYQ